MDLGTTPRGDPNKNKRDPQVGKFEGNPTVTPDKPEENQPTIKENEVKTKPPKMTATTPVPQLAKLNRTWEQSTVKSTELCIENEWNDEGTNTSSRSMTQIKKPMHDTRAHQDHQQSRLKKK